MLERRAFLGSLVAAGGLARAFPARAGSAPSTAKVSTAAELAEQLVAAMGGREAWAPLLGLSVRARHHETGVENPYDNALFLALAEPRMRFEGRSATMRRVRVVVGSRGWRVSELSPRPGPLAPEVVKSDLEWWETHVYRNVWRLARRDPTLTLRRADDGRLELYRPDGTRLMWYRLNQRGEPVAFGRFESDVTATILGPLQPVPGGVRLPIFSASSDGSFRAVEQRATVYTTVPPVDYNKP